MFHEAAFPVVFFPEVFFPEVLLIATGRFVKSGLDYKAVMWSPKTRRTPGPPSLRVTMPSADCGMETILQ